MSLTDQLYVKSLQEWGVQARLEDEYNDKIIKMLKNEPVKWEFSKLDYNNK